MAKIIDVHNHLYPRDYLDYLVNRKDFPNMEKVNPTTWVFSSQGVVIAKVFRAGHYDPNARIEDMDKNGIDIQMISSTMPGIELLPVDEGVRWAKRMNDYFAEVCQIYPGRFFMYATLPLQNVGESLKELDRAYHKLGAKGLMIFSTINGNPLSSPEYYPIYALAEEYNLPILIHPGIPSLFEACRKHKIPPGIYGYTTDTTLAIVSLIWHGVLEKYPKLNFIHSHLGGIFPYLVERMEVSWKLFGKELGVKLEMSPTEYYQRQVYPDTMSGYLPAARCCLELMGAKHLVLGTDYAHGNGNIEEAVAFVKSMGLSQKDTTDILGGNAVRLFNLK
jgi:aminocarboxymuconate-semialdehyde decarboxylase